MNEQENNLLTVKQVASLLDIGPRTIHRWIAQGHFSGAYKVGFARNSRYRIPQSDVDVFLQKIKECQATNTQEES